MPIRHFLLLLALLFFLGPRALPAQPEARVNHPGEDAAGDRNATHGPPERHSTYVRMRDSVRLAVDYYLPEDRAAGEPLPTLLFVTRYVRSLETCWAVRWLKPYATTTLHEEEIEYWVKHGYAVVAVDARGSGASLGRRKMELSPTEWKDSGEVVDWIIQQPWSDGTVGASGVSYVGTTALQLLINQHPAVKAIVPRSAIFDVYDDVMYVGGIQQRPFLKVWSQTIQALDAGNFGYFGLGAGALLKGIMPVQSPRGGELLARARQLHQANTDVLAGLDSVVFRGDGHFRFNGELIELTTDDISPHHYLAKIRASETPIHWVSGYYDGAIVSSAAKGMMNLPQQSKLLLGPWDHGLKDQASPHASSPAVNMAEMDEYRRFFDRHLKGIENGIEEEPPVRYYTVGEEAWHWAEAWPPPEASPQTWHLSGDHHLSTRPPKGALEFASFRPSYAFATSDQSRWNSQTPQYKNGHTSYAAFDEHAEELGLRFTSAPLKQPITLAGHPVVDLRLSADTTDAPLAVYLIDVAPDGSETYITEGHFRALHRQVVDEGPYETPGPAHSFRRADARPLKPGEVEQVRFGLQPISYRLPAGHRLRLGIAALDTAHFAYDGPRPQKLSFHGGTSLTLPVMPAENQRAEAR